MPEDTKPKYKCPRCKDTGFEPETNDQQAKDWYESQDPRDPSPEECRDCIWERDNERMMGHGY
jgi:hypothetical protein